MDWLTHLFLYGTVTMRLDMSNARPAFTDPNESQED